MVLDPADPDTYSAGSFFTNPILREHDVRASSSERAKARLGPDAVPPSWPTSHHRYLKTSAAWLIQQAGFQRGYGDPDGIAISSKHTLALTNRGGGTTAQLVARDELGRRARAAVRQREHVLRGDRDRLRVAVTALEAGALDEPRGERSSRSARRRSARMAARRPEAELRRSPLDELAERVAPQDRVRRADHADSLSGSAGSSTMPLPRRSSSTAARTSCSGARGALVDAEPSRELRQVADRLGTHRTARTRSSRGSTTQRSGSRLKALER